jgi:dienelactone hydrolase
MRAPRRRRLSSPVRAGALALLAAALAAPALAATGGTGGPGAAHDPSPGFAVGVRVLRYLDAGRLARPRHRRPFARALPVVVRYPAAAGAPGERDMPGASPARNAGPFPLVVFAHGFAVTPATYSRLLRAWARAGYVVAAPVFPLENANAPGGPDQSDLVNEPADMSFVITQLLAADAAPDGPLSGLIDPARIAVAGQSDGGIAALTLAYGKRARDPRLHAAVILSGAEMSGIGGYSFAAGPPLLAVQGTADPINAPRYTYAYFAAAARPKYLLRLLGAGHLPPVTSEQPQLGVVERTTTAFLDDYARGAGGAAARLAALGDVPGVAALTARP